MCIVPCVLDSRALGLYYSQERTRTLDDSSLGPRHRRCWERPPIRIGWTNNSILESHWSVSTVAEIQATSQWLPGILRNTASLGESQEPSDMSQLTSKPNSRAWVLTLARGSGTVCGIICHSLQYFLVVSWKPADCLPGQERPLSFGASPATFKISPVVSWCYKFRKRHFCF